MEESKPTIVAIDDEAQFIDMLREYFELRGYDISISSKGVEGIELINAKKPDIVILDLKMPGISGDEVLKLLGATHPTARVIFISAFDDMGKTKSNLLSSGAFAFLEKPLKSLKELEEVVKRAYSSKNEAESD